MLPVLTDQEHLYSQMNSTFLRYHYLKLPLVFILLLSSGFYNATSAQSEDEPGKSIGLSGGFYNPSFDLFDQSVWNFSHTPSIGAEFDYRLNKFLFLKTGIDFFSSEADVVRPDLNWHENLKFEFIPIHISILGNYQLEYFSLYGGPGIEFINISTSYSSPDESQFKSGYASVFNFNIGVQKTFDRFSVSLNSKYIFGGFKQRMVVGENLERNSEVSLNGLKAGASVKYIF